MFEGIDGSGKTTQLNLLAGFLRERRLEFEVTREPGGTPIGEMVRDIVLNIDCRGLDPVGEALLYAAARADLVSFKIYPALQNGKVVLCDRFVDSSYAYQGYGSGLDLSCLKNVNRFATRDLVPHVTILLDIPVEEGLRRLRGRREKADRIETQGYPFYRRVREGYLALAEEHPERYCLLNANLPVGDVHRGILGALKERFVLFSEC